MQGPLLKYLQKQKSYIVSKLFNYPRQFLNLQKQKSYIVSKQLSEIAFLSSSAKAEILYSF